MNNREVIHQWALGMDESTLMADGFDDALVGVVYKDGLRCVYDEDKIIKILMKRDKMTHEEAVEYFEFNIEGAHMGPTTPIYMTSIKAIKKFV